MADWDKRYDTPELIYGAEPSEFLRDNADLLPRAGLALDIAAGEGRNSVFLAERGLFVIALDRSFRALQKCLRRAGERGTSVYVAAVDLTEFVLPPNSFDVIVDFNYLQRGLARRIVEGLKQGGLLIFETYTLDYLKWKPDFNREFLLRPGELVEVFRGLHLIKYREATLASGQSARPVASIVARKD